MGSVLSSGNRYSGWIAQAASFVLVFLVFVPFFPSFPADGLDNSYRSAMNVAVEQGLQFGRDVIFTYGPFASVHSELYSPGTDGLMLGGSLLVAALICMVFGKATVRATRFAILGLPLLISERGYVDAILICLPLLYLLCILDISKNQTGQKAAVLFGAATLALLPLVKVSVAPSVLLCGCIAVFCVARHNPRLAFAGGCVFLLSMCLAWHVAGQSILNLPSFFITSLPVVTGFADGMSSFGSVVAILAFIASAFTIIYACWQTGASHRLLATVATAGTLFFCFKAGFVRQDGHVVEGTYALIFVAYFLVLQRPGKVTLVTLLLAMVTWVFCTSPYRDNGPDAIGMRFEGALRHSASGIKFRIFDPEHFDRINEEQLAEVRRAHPLPDTQNSADLYPNDLSILFANGLNWHPRPVLQSYSAYAPALARSDERHLESSPPGTVFFSVDPIDGHYPSLEDGASWLPLIDHYSIKSRAGSYAVLDFSAVDKALSLGAPILSTAATLGSPVDIPDGDDPIFAKIVVKPTVLGRIASLLFKASHLQIRTNYANGRISTYRYIAGMGETGFVLSPTVSTTTDFILLQSPQWKDYLASNIPRSFTIYDEGKSSWFWRERFDVMLYKVHFNHDSKADFIAYPPPATIRSVSDLPRAKDCNIDSVNGSAAGSLPMDVKSALMEVNGWAMIDGNSGQQSDAVSAALILPNGTGYIYPLQKALRTDIALHFGHPKSTMNGFRGTIAIPQIRGQADLRIVQRVGSQDFLCDRVVRIMR